MDSECRLRPRDLDEVAEHRRKSDESAISATAIFPRRVHVLAARGSNRSVSPLTPSPTAGNSGRKSAAASSEGSKS